MARDTINYLTGLVSSRVNTGFIEELGEIQQDFNMGLTLDGTKDSVHFQVISYTIREALKPYTVLNHVRTNTWWIVSHDKVMRYTNESGYMYVHEIDCLGAIELLNARDLTDCGFRSNVYDIDNVAERLMKLSNFEYSFGFNYYGIDESTKVDYIKTFENYTLLSALREFFNGYNCGLKVADFRVVGEGSGTNRRFKMTMFIDVISKTGNTRHEIKDIDYFTDVRETKSIDKDSYGTTVVTNAQNVVNTKVSVFPSVGTVGLSSVGRVVYTETGDLVPSTNVSEDAVIRLPAPAYKVNKLSIICCPYMIYVSKNGSTTDMVQYSTENRNPYDSYAYDSIFNSLKNLVENSFGSEVADKFESNKKAILQGVKDASTFDLYDGFLYDAINDNDTSGYCPFKYPKNAPSGMKLIKFRNEAHVVPVERYIVLTDKDTRSSFLNPFQGIYWERGSRYIRGFGYFGIEADVAKRTEFSYSVKGSAVIYSFMVGGDNYIVTLDPYNTISSRYGAVFKPSTMTFKVEYIPMTDLKVLTDNDNKTQDIQLYNQSGKMTDSVGLSKLINSYANEITDESITRYKDFYNFDEIPNVGDLINNQGTYYVINNISIDFHQHEQINDEIQYMLEGEFSMSKQVAVKSLMVNANSNIRDYGIPQTNNVARKQVYRDIFSFDNKTIVGYGNGDYLHLENILEFEWGNITSSPYEDYIAFITTFAQYPTYNNGDPNPTGETTAMFYQLPTTRFVLKKQVVYKTDFNDNNIIGYDSQDIASGFSTNNLLLTASRNINTPISYVDENGEVRGIEIAFVNSDKATEIYNDYASINGFTSLNFIQQRVFIDSDLYDFAESVCDFRIDESNTYLKDALEIPVFEVCAQIISSDNVVIGENILDEIYEVGKTYRVFYEYVYVDDYLTEQNALSYSLNSVYAYMTSLFDIGLKIDDACVIKNDSENQLYEITLYDEAKLRFSTGKVLGNQIQPTAGKNLAVFRHVWDSQQAREVKTDFMFMIKNIPSSSIIPTVRDIQANCDAPDIETIFYDSLGNGTRDANGFVSIHDGIDTFTSVPEIVSAEIYIYFSDGNGNNDEISVDLYNLEASLDSSGHLTIVGTFSGIILDESDWDFATIAATGDAYEVVNIRDGTGGQIKLYYTKIK